MKSTGIIRHVDEVGRIVIPKEIRDLLGIKEKERVKICTNENFIILRKNENSCFFCNDTKELASFNGKLICINCMQQIAKMGRE